MVRPTLQHFLALDTQTYVIKNNPHVQIPINQQQLTSFMHQVGHIPGPNASYPPINY